MKKFIFSTIGITTFALLTGGTVFAQGMMGFINSPPDNATIQSQQQEEQEGKIFLDELTNKTITCSQLKDADFDKIGEYFMGQSIGDTSRHIAMNEMMKRMMGEQGEEQTHITMGKRLSGCDTSAAFPSQDAGFIPMMGMMGNWSNSASTNYNQPNGFYSMMGNWGWGWPSFMIIWWLLIIVLVAAFIGWAVRQSRRDQDSKGKTPLDILKDRYVKGEIDKKEFEEKKKDLV